MSRCRHQLSMPFSKFFLLKVHFHYPFTIVLPNLLNIEKKPNWAELDRNLSGRRSKLVRYLARPSSQSLGCFWPENRGHCWSSRSRRQMTGNFCRWHWPQSQCTTCSPSTRQGQTNILQGNLKRSWSWPRTLELCCSLFRSGSQPGFRFWPCNSVMRNNRFQQKSENMNPCPGHLSLKVPSVEFYFDVCVDSIQFLTHTSKT